MKPMNNGFATDGGQTDGSDVMTDLTGSMFIYHRRSPARITSDEEARQVLIRDARRDRGIPTWRDLDDLGPSP